MNQDILDAPGLFIEYRGDPSLPYGVDATAHAQPFEFLICHYTGTSAPFENLVKYTLRVDKARGGQFGYHFVIRDDGHIVQTAPLSKRTNHIRSNRDIGVNNTNAVGVSLHARDEGHVSPAQVRAGLSLGIWLGEVFHIAKPNHYGHGEINAHKDPAEGLTLARLLRSK